MTARVDKANSATTSCREFSIRKEVFGKTCSVLGATTMARLFVICLFTQVVCYGLATDQLDRIKRAPRVKRIIGGHDIIEGEWPWLVHLKGKIPSRTFWGIPLSYKTFYCGGSIINRRWILTAAHCFVQPSETNPTVKSHLSKPKHWHITAGEVKRTHTVIDSIKSVIGGWFNIRSWQLYFEHAETIVKHPAYRASSRQLWPNDIALVKASEDLPLGVAGRHIDAIQLPDTEIQNWPQKDSNCTVKGWGCTYKGGPLPVTAKAVVLPIRKEEVCDKLYGSEIGPKRLCAGPEYKNKGICAGDSGGPLVCHDGYRSWHQAGIASFTSGTRPGQVPGVYTRVSEYRSWIDTVIKVYN